MDLRGLMFQVGAAAMQVAAAGHTDEAARSSRDTRRALYKILAEDEPADDTREIAIGGSSPARPQTPR